MNTNNNINNSMNNNINKNMKKPVYITGIGAFLPNDPVDNDQIENLLGVVGGKPSRLKRRILSSNGIKTRYYALNADGKTTHLNEDLAANAVINALKSRGMPISQVKMLAVGTTQGDMPVPGFASMVHGKLGASGAGPMSLLSSGGVCCAGMAALQNAFLHVQGSGVGPTADVAVACGSELTSRMFKASRFETEGAHDPQANAQDNPSFRDFDADFLRWMLSDGAGAVVLENQPNPQGLSLRIDWVTVTSYANEYPVCMYTGTADKNDVKAGNTWLDYPTIADADRARLMNLRQDTRVLPQIVKLGVEEYVRLLKMGLVRSEEVDHVLCHYSSHFFKGEIFKMMQELQIHIPEEKWFSNLYTKGNTGAASIFIMLEEAMRTGRFKRGEQIILMVPESGRFTVAYAKLTCVGPEDHAENIEQNDEQQPTSVQYAVPRWSAGVVGKVERRSSTNQSHTLSDAETAELLAESPLGTEWQFDDEKVSHTATNNADSSQEVQRWLAIELALVWADFERMLRAVPLLQRLDEGTFRLADYQRLLCNLRQQVMEGARWIARAASSLSIELFPLRSMFLLHAGEEHRDFQLLERDFCSVGGTLQEITQTPKNIGSEALSSFMFHHASQPDPLDMIGAMFIVEGLGTKKAYQWGLRIKELLKLDEKQLTFLLYHGKNDDRHFEKLRDVVRSGIITREVASRIVKTAKVTARLYALQLEEIDHV